VNKASGLRCVGVVLLLLLTVGIPAIGRQRVAVFVQAAVPVPAAELQIIRNYAIQRCMVITGTRVSSIGEMMHAQRLTNTWIGTRVSVDGMRRLAQTLNVNYIIVMRIVRWESRISFQPERSLLVFGLAALFDREIQLLTSPLGLFLGLEQEATVALFVTVFDPAGNIVFATKVAYADRPLLSLLTANPLEAAKRAIDSVLFQVAVAL